MICGRSEQIIYRHSGVRDSSTHHQSSGVAFKVEMASN